MKSNNSKGSSQPTFKDWKLKTSKEAEMITNISNFQSVKAVVQTVENQKGETVFGWIADYNGGHMFIPYNSDQALNPLSNWFEQIEPITI